MRQRSVVVLGGGVSGLAAALSLQDARRERHLPLQIQLIEASERLGGLVRTFSEGPFLLEQGPVSMSRTRDAAIRLCRRLGVELIAPERSPAETRVLVDGEVVRLPAAAESMTASSYWPIVASPLLKARFHAKAGAGPALQHAGSVVDDAMRGLFLTPRRGMDELVRALRRELRDVRVRLETPVRTIVERTEEDPVDEHGDPMRRWALDVGEEDPSQADALILALPSVAAAALLHSVDPVLAALVGSIPTGSVATLNLVFRKGDFSAPGADAPTLLIPEAENRLISTLEQCSLTFGGRSDEEHVALRVSIRDAEAVRTMDEEQLYLAAMKELTELFEVRGAPRLRHVARMAYVLPEPGLEHADRVVELEARLADHPGLALAGNLWKGAGLSIAIESAQRAADTVLATLFQP